MKNLHGLAASAALLAASAAMAEGTVVGRLVFKEGDRVVSLRDVNQASHKNRLSLELRQGSDIISADVDDDGYFTASGKPGPYRLEYLNLGDRAEFLTPKVVEIRDGAAACAGTFEVRVGSINELGANVKGSDWTVLDECSQIAPRLKRRVRGDVQPGVAQDGPVLESSGGKTWIEYLVGLRADIGWGHLITARGAYALGLNGGLGDKGALMVQAAGGLVMGHTSAGGGMGFEGAAGVGYAVLSGIEVWGFGGFRTPVNTAPPGPVFGAQARIGSYGMGLGLRGELQPGAGAFAYVTLDFSPFYVVGSFL
jgi:hypothetical protein